jgi:CRP-like cAMP-binding protein
MTKRQMRLSLRAGESLPCNVSWRIDDGYLRLVSWSNQAEMLTLGIWGPGDLVIPSMVTLTPIELLSISAVTVEEWEPTSEQRQAFLLEQLGQVSTLLLLTRIRPAENRLYQLLLWLGERFGRVNSRGVGLSISDMNLTHRQLAEIVATTRVTVTKALTRFRTEGLLVKDGNDELLIRNCR